MNWTIRLSIAGSILFKSDFLFIGKLDEINEEKGLWLITGLSE